ncbi:MAG: dephospho-CoA kinase-domain-containing protein [Monoraphidium minutum]|nr:MAG: dephospho-CoA kinase-domain-containing protein [Monoraphidium minutum]
MRIVGLTGGITCGKSTVTAALRRRGFLVIDCDKIRTTWGHRRVVAAFGSGVLQPDGELDRDALGRAAFGDASARRRLNASTHLPVALELLRRLAAAWLALRTVVVIDMLLFETGSHRFTRPSVLVVAEPQEQLRRLMARDGSAEADARSRVAAQMPLASKLALADVAVDALVRRPRRGALLPALLTSPYGLALGGAALRAWGPRLLAALARGLRA